MPKYEDDRIPLRVMNLERDLAILDARCRECSERTRNTLKIIAEELSRFGAHVATDVAKINKRIDAFVCPSKDFSPKIRKAKS
jgi:hypothetical protein